MIVAVYRLQLYVIPKILTELKIFQGGQGPPFSALMRCFFSHRPVATTFSPVMGTNKCTEWWEAFAAMAEVALKADFLSGAEQRALLQRQRTMGARHLDLGWGKTLWTHMWVDHMYAYVARWGTIARFSCFALEGSHVRLKRLLRNSGGVSLLNDRSGLQCVVDNHTLDDHLRKEGWEVESRAVNKQRGFQRRCMTWSRARRERKGRENMVRRIVERALRQRTK